MALLRWRFYPFVRSFFGIAICSLAVTPLFLLVMLTSEFVKGRSLRYTIEKYLDIEPEKFLAATLQLSSITFPILILIALLIYALGRQEKDTWVCAIAAGTVVGFVAPMMAMFT